MGLRHATGPHGEASDWGSVLLLGSGDGGSADGKVDRWDGSDHHELADWLVARRDRWSVGRVDGSVQVGAWLGGLWWT